MLGHRVVSATAKIHRNSEILACAEQGESVAALARRYGLSRIRIQQILADHPKTMRALGASMEFVSVHPQTELESLPISARLFAACRALGLKKVADLSIGIAALTELPNIGHRTRLEAQELVRRAGVGMPKPMECGGGEVKPRQNKRSALRKRNSAF